MKYNLIDFMNTYLPVIFYAIGLFTLFSMKYISINSKYKITRKIWIKSFLFGFVIFSISSTLFFLLPLMFSFKLYEMKDSFILCTGALGFCFSYYCMAFYCGIYSFKEESKAMICMNQWIDSQRELKMEKRKIDFT